MVITCPHALGLAVPLVVAVSTTLSAKNGLLIRNRAAFEQARNIQAVVFVTVDGKLKGAIARATYNKMVQNLIWATGYNAFALWLQACSIRMAFFSRLRCALCLCP